MVESPFNIADVKIVKNLNIVIGIIQFVIAFTDVLDNINLILTCCLHAAMSGVSLYALLLSYWHTENS